MNAPKTANGSKLTDNESAQQPFRNVERINTKIPFRRYLDLRTLDDSKLTKRANQPGMHDMVAQIWLSAGLQNFRM